MTKKKLKKRIRSLEHALGQVLELQEYTDTRLKDLEEVVFEFDGTEPETADDLVKRDPLWDPTGIPQFNMLGPSGDN